MLGIDVRDRFVSSPILNLVIEGFPINGDPYKLIIEMGKVLEMDLNKRDFSLAVYMKKNISRIILL